jgi:hypothetical protein
MCRSNASNRLAPWIFKICLQRKLRLPVFDNTTTKPFCCCRRRPDKFGNHVFQCTRICKIGVHNNIRNGLPPALTPALSTAGYLLATSTFQIEKPMLHLRSDPNAQPFDIAFSPEASIPPAVSHACPYHTIGVDITISSPPPCCPLVLDSTDAKRILSANADSHLQVFEKRKLCHGNKHDPNSGQQIRAWLGIPISDSDSGTGRNPEFRFRVRNSGTFQQKIKSENLKTVQVENRNSGSDFSGIPEFRSLHT